MEYTPQNIYSSDNSRSYGQTPKGVEHLLNCVKTGWANHPKYAAMVKKMFTQDYQIYFMVRRLVTNTPFSLFRIEI